MKSCNPSKYSIALSLVILSNTICNADNMISGVVTDIAGKSLNNAKITILSTEQSTSSNDFGKWSLTQPNNTAIKPKYATTKIKVIHSNLFIEAGRMHVKFNERNINGTSINTTQSYQACSLKKTEPANRSNNEFTSDSILISWNGRVRARVLLSSYASGVLDTLKIDTSTLVNDIPWNSAVAYSNLIDSRDGQSYRTIQIGSQIWMAENLNYRRDSSWCFAASIDSCIKYGRLYQWASAMDTSTIFNSAIFTHVNPYKGICPISWHLPSDSEYGALIKYSDSSKSAINLKSTTGWNSLGGTDTFGFRALPAYSSSSLGISNPNRSSSNNIGYTLFLWTSSQKAAGQIYRKSIDYSFPNVISDVMSGNSAFSIRCIKD